MSYIVSLTSQGQISIPASLRRKLGFNKKSKVVIEEENGKLVVEPIQDVLGLQGAFKTSIKGTKKEERQAFETYLSTRAIEK